MIASVLAVAIATAAPQSTPGKAGIEWMQIPGGSFRMGEDDARTPAHRVRLKAFELSRSAVTNKQYRACVAAKACTAARDFGPKFSADDQPVVGVDFAQAVRFARWAGGRLPSEAEWEYAARSGGRNQIYPWGNGPISCARAVIYDRTLGGFACGRKAPWPVCSKPAGDSAQGVCDLGGNVNEWTQDLAHSQYYDGAPSDGSAWEDPQGATNTRDRIIRGRSWDDGDSASLNARSREWERPESRLDYLGFRVAR